MFDAIDVLAGSQPVTADDEEMLAAYARAFQQDRPTTRFFLSASYLAAQPAVYRWARAGGCLVLLKRRTIQSHRMVYLVVPPISEINDHQREADVMLAFQQQHVGTMLSPEDVALYGVPDEMVRPDPTRWPEFCYVADTWAPIPPGREGKNGRAAWNQLKRGGVDAARYVTAIPHGGELEDLAERWYRQTGRGRHVRRIVRAFADHAYDGTWRRSAQLVYADGRLVAASLTEEATPGHVIIVSRLRDYEWRGMADPTLALHVADCKYWKGIRPGHTIRLTSGSAGTRSLEAHKAKLRPATALPLGRLRTAREWTKEEWDASAYRRAEHPSSQPTLF